MKKFLLFLLLLVIGSVAAGIYGVLHDQITYTISSEYFTLFKFRQFGRVVPLDFFNLPPRLAVSIVGWMATWWVGFIAAIILGLFGLIHKEPREMFKRSMQAFIFVIAAAVLFGFIGYFFAKFSFFDNLANWYIPEGLLDWESFRTVGTIHNFSYLGGAVGNLAGIFWQFYSKSTKYIMAKAKRKLKKQSIFREKNKVECETISKLLFEKDPIGINYENNTDEYDSEAVMIFQKLNKCRSVEDVKTLVYQVFVGQFDKEIAGPIEHYADIAEELYKKFLQIGKK